SKSKTRPAGGPPLFVNRRSTGPNRSTVVRCHSAIAVSDARSAANVRTWPPLSCWIRAPAALMASGLREAMETCAPSPANACATASPSPLLPPPIIATFPFSPRFIENHAPGYAQISDKEMLEDKGKDLIG